MRAVVITAHGDPDVLRVEERPDPAAGRGQIAIDVRAAGINFADLMARIGLYPDAPKPPCVVGYEVAGTVSAVGDGVNAFRPGDRVLAGTRFGGYAERVAVGVGNAVALPEGLSFEQGAAIPVNYATAWAALHQLANLASGERVLVHSAGGGVGIAATQIAKRAGAEVWGTASAGKHDRLRELGLDHPLDYRHAGWERDVPELDVVLDAIGGRSFRTSYGLLRAGGRLVCFGASAVVAGERRNIVQAGRAALTMPRFNLIKQMSQSKSVMGLNLLTLWDDRGTLEPWIAPLRELIADATVQPVVAEAFAFDRAPDAHRFLGERRNVGKVVLTP